MICVSFGQVNLRRWTRLILDILRSISGRMETLNMKKFHGIAKVCGILFSLAGVVVLAFYQGPEMKSFNHHHLFHHISNFHGEATAHPRRTWILGIFLTTLSTTSWALWTVLQVWKLQEFFFTSSKNIIKQNCWLAHDIYLHSTCSQGPMLEAYPSKLLNTTLQMIFATIQSFFIALVAERDFAKWRLGLDARLIAVVYSVSSISSRSDSVTSASLFLATDEHLVLNFLFFEKRCFVNCRKLIIRYRIINKWKFLDYVFSLFIQVEQR